jgi:heme exporter protein A
VSGVPTGNTLLAVRRLSCAAGPRPLFTDLDFDLQPGRWTMLTGPNGSGKTTLLRAIAGLVRPLAGNLSWEGHPCRPASAEWHARFVYQGHAAGWKSEWTVAENLRAQVALDSGRSAAGPALDDAIARVGLERRRNLPFGRLSAGQRRRLSLARLALGARPLWLLDEPTTALDVDGQRILAELIDTHLDRGGCALIATHQSLSARHEPDALQLAAAR